MLLNNNCELVVWKKKIAGIKKQDYVQTYHVRKKTCLLVFKESLKAIWIFTNHGDFKHNC